jgi:hypothetical protein
MKIVINNKIKIFIYVITTLLLVYLLIYIDVVLRAKEAYLQGEKYWSWYENPSLKEIELKKKLKNDIIKLGKKLAKRKIDKEKYEKELEILKFKYKNELEESSIKYAYVWYQTAVELFSPPESKWVKLARTKMLIAKEKWKQELRQKNIPFEDYMIE